MKSPMLSSLSTPLLLAAVTVACFASGAQAAVVVADAGFETPSIGSNNYLYTPTGTPWTYSSAGVSANGSPFLNPLNSPEGNQSAFVQGTGSVSQTLTGFSAGSSYNLTFSYAPRLGSPDNGGQDFNVLLDSTLLGHYTTVGSNSFQTATVAITKPGAGSHTLSFVGLNTIGGDHSVNLDAVSIQAANAQSLTIYNTGVVNAHAPITATASGVFDPHWTLSLSDGAGASNAPNAFVKYNFPHGAWVDNTSTAQWIGPENNDVGSPEGNYTYTETFDLTGYDPSSAILSGKYAEDSALVGVTLDGVALSGFASGHFSYFTSFLISSGFQPGINTLSFTVRRIGAGGDTGLIVDNQSLTAVPLTSSVPEPASLGMLTLATLGLLARRR